MLIARTLPSAILVPLPNRLADVGHWLSAVDPGGAILSGGNDWGESAERDATESALVDWMAARSLPVFGACRGLQALNAICGGTVIDLDDQARQRHIGVAHRVAIAHEGLSGRISRQDLEVNSFHGQAVIRSGLAPVLSPFAMAEKDLVEGVFHLHKPMLAVQWHPERAGSDRGADEILIRSVFGGDWFWL